MLIKCLYLQNCSNPFLTTPPPRYYANIHTTAQQFLLPYGYTRDLPADYDDLMTFHNAVNDAMDYNYAVGPVYTTIYPASGIPSDAYYDGNGITRPVKYSTAWEWRGGGFQPNPTDPVKVRF